MNPLMNAMKGNNMDAFKVVQMLKNRNPQEVFNQMMQSNQAFRNFYEQNKGKSPEQVAKEHGVDLSQLKNMM